MNKPPKIAVRKPPPDTIGWNPDWEVIAVADKAVFQSLNTMRSQPMEIITQDSRSGVSRLRLTATYYVKMYGGIKETFRQLFGASRFEIELGNLFYFSELGIHTPRVATYGREMRWGLLRQAAIVTLAVSDSVTLEKLIDSGEFYARGVQYARALLKQLAQTTKLLHDDHFFHRDLKTRNILVQNNGQQCQLYFFDCPTGYHPPRLLRGRSIIRDLAYLERGLRGHVRKVDMLYFYKHYRGSARLSEEDKQLARASLSYYAERRMTKKRKRRALARGQSPLS